MATCLRLMFAAALSVVQFLPDFAYAEELLTARSLPLTVAVAAAMEAVNACKANGFNVTATILDSSGNVQVVLRGDRATVHTKDNSFRKAYTIVTLGPIAGADTTSLLTTIVSKYPPLNVQELANTPNVTLLAGGAAFKSGNEIIGGVGVSGAPGGANDEVCAKAAVAKAEDLLR